MYVRLFVVVVVVVVVADVLIGQGAFGKVMKAYATDINGVEGRTTVAVKMVRGVYEFIVAAVSNRSFLPSAFSALACLPRLCPHACLIAPADYTDREQVKALMSELKVLIHIGQHLNVLNLLGAVTKDTQRGKCCPIDNNSATTSLVLPKPQHEGNVLKQCIVLSFVYDIPQAHVVFVWRC